MNQLWRSQAVGRQLLLLSCAAMCIGSPAAQEILWTRTFGGAASDWAESVESTADGGFVIAGYSASFGGGGWDVYVIRTDWRGQTLWSRTYGTPGQTDAALCVQQTDDGGFVVALQEGIGDLLRLNADGDSLWVGDYGIQAAAVRQTADGGFIVAGDSMGTCCLVKTDPRGALLWRHAYPSGEFSRAFAVVEVDDGGYATGGCAWSVAGSWDYHIVRAAQNGNPLWERTYGRLLQEDEGWAICETEDGGFVITGLYFGTLKVDAVGDSVWSRYYGAGEIGCATSICSTIGGGFLVGGYLNPCGPDEGDYYLVRVDSEGDPLWQRSYGGAAESFDNGRCARQTADGAYIMVGWSDAFGDGDMDVWLVRIDGESSSVGMPDHARDGGAAGVKIELIGPNPIPLSGNRTAARGRLAYRLSAAADVQVDVRSVLGQRLHHVTRQHSAPGRYELEWPSAAQTSGVYFVNLRAGSQISTSKIVVVR